ncbi:MAG: DUF3667 domain-containing protein [Bacteroidia bacterium]
MKEENNEKTLQIVCKNCETEFEGNFCPNCGQSTKEFERPVRFLIIDLLGNMFAFDTRFWKTFIAVLFKPGALTLDYVNGHRVKYMPPFRFFIFVSFFFFLALKLFSAQMLNNDAQNTDFISITDIEQDSTAKAVLDSIETEFKAPDPEEIKKAEENLKLLQEHPELFIQKFLSYFSWSMFLLMPIYGVLLWLFYKNSQPFYATNFILAINQHSFAFVVLLLIVIFHIIFPNIESNFVNYLALIVPVYIIWGQKTLYQKKLKIIFLRLFAIGIIYSILLFFTTLALVFLVLRENGIGV